LIGFDGVGAALDGSPTLVLRETARESGGVTISEQWRGFCACTLRFYL
jgi:hypothetical protein